MHTQLKLLTLAALLGALGSAQAASLGASGYSQSFDSMSTTKALPTDWSVWKVGDSHSAWESAITANGGSHSVAAMTLVGSTAQAALLDTAITTSTKNANAYNIAHSTSASDRVLATSPTGIDGNALQLLLTNNTNTALSGIAISYDIVKFYNGNKQSGIDSSMPLGEELPGYQLFYSLNGGSWNNVAALNPVSTADGIHPLVATGSVNANGSTGPLDYGVTSISNARVSFSSLWAAGQTLRLRWVDDNAVNISPDQMIGLNNVSITPVPEPESYAMFLAGLGLLALARRRRS
ncbi:PEP-CTERM sorting domain-containing protein [Rhodocyclus tenuis]|uniref:Ice-binding protein C-terminal domain-containing protein n=1 Tax=Rhodocyclus tenuis TaxID=1066 RepID=A0A840G9U7_RHOTE|nr:PEP-CTERM sorting domain-containing protein [Rhodocyclus tenuis]MBB4249103.1 hypothetical protein [Rhodocyclus tenuis]